MPSSVLDRAGRDLVEAVEQPGVRGGRGPLGERGRASDVGEQAALERDLGAARAARGGRGSRRCTSAGWCVARPPITTRVQRAAGPPEGRGAHLAARAVGRTRPQSERKPDEGPVVADAGARATSASSSPGGWLRVGRHQPPHRWGCMARRQPRRDGDCQSALSISGSARFVVMVHGWRTSPGWTAARAVAARWRCIDMANFLLTFHGGSYAGDQGRTGPGL